MKLSFLVIPFIYLILPTRQHGQSTSHDSIPRYTFLTDKNATNPLIRGVWQSIGNGYRLEIRKDSILLYSYTQSFCYKEKNDYLEELLNTQSRFILRGDTLGLYLTDYGLQTTCLQTKKDFIRIDALPKNCLSFAEQTRLKRSALFELYRETLEENYAFAQRRKLQWAEIFSPYRDSTWANEYNLFKAMGEIATITQDQHTKVISSQFEETLQYRITPSALIVQKAFENQTKIKTFGQYADLFFKTSYRNISDSLLQGNGNTVANGKIEWGTIQPDIGYIHVHSFAGYLGAQFSRQQQIDSLRRQMKAIISDLRDKKAIIVDISFNFGGYDATALTIAGYFTDRPVPAYTSQVLHRKAFYNEDTVTVYPSDSIAFTKPVYLMMTDISRSAAEAFAMMMGALPNVRLVGSRTLGTLSGMLGKSIGNFYTTYSNQRFLTREGNYYEAIGVQPDIEMEIFTDKKVMDGHKAAVLKLVDQIAGN